MKGLIKEAKSFMEEAKNKNIMNVGLIAAAQHVEHYEIAGYDTAVRYAKELGYNDAASILQKTLDQEYNADHLLDILAETGINKKAVKQMFIAVYTAYTILVYFTNYSLGSIALDTALQFELNLKFTKI